MVVELQASVPSASGASVGTRCTDTSSASTGAAARGSCSRTAEPVMTPPCSFPRHSPEYPPTVALMQASRRTFVLGAARTPEATARAQRLGQVWKRAPAGTSYCHHANVAASELLYARLRGLLGRRP